MATKKKVEKEPMKIFVGIPKGLSKVEREKAKEIIESKLGTEFGTYIYPLRNGKLVTVLKCLAGCDAAMFYDEHEDFKYDLDMLTCVEVCKAFNIPIYK